jgi:hypothetical protein
MCLVCIKKPIQARKGGIAQRWFLAKAQSKGFSRMCLVCIKKPIQARKGTIGL